VGRTGATRLFLVNARSSSTPDPRQREILVFLPEDPGAPDDLAKEGNLPFGFGLRERSLGERWSGAADCAPD
jgi:hypothetical protein